MAAPLGEDALDQLFRTARTQRSWREEDVPEALIRSVYDLLRLGPTASNITPARFLFLRSPAARARLEPHLDAGNVRATLAAPWTVIVAYDLAFGDHLGKLIPHAPEAAGWFADASVAQWHAMQSGTLQAGYLILAARALGLDCGPMSGFRREGVDEAFFLAEPSMRTWRSSLIVNIGYGDGARVRARAPRLDFTEACRIL